MQRSSLPEQTLLAKRIGGRYARNAMFVGLFCAALIFIQDGWETNSSFNLVKDYPLQSIICVIGGPLIGTLFGRWTGTMILLYNRNAFLFSLSIGFLSVLATSLLFSSVAFFSENLSSLSRIKVAALSYIQIPVLGTLFHGSPFIVLVAGGMALFLRRARKKHFSGSGSH